MTSFHIEVPPIPESNKPIDFSFIITTKIPKKKNWQSLAKIKFLENFGLN